MNQAPEYLKLDDQHVEFDQHGRVVKVDIRAFAHALCEAIYRHGKTVNLGPANLRYHDGIYEVSNHHGVVVGSHETFDDAMLDVSYLHPSA